MVTKVKGLPIWKKGATPEERFLELAQLAREKPERFIKFAVVYVEEKPESFCSRVLNHNLLAVELVGYLTIAAGDVAAGRGGLDRED